MTTAARNLTVGPTGPTLVRLAVPMLFGIAAIMLFNIVDTFWVGQLGATQLAAMSFTFPVGMVVMSVSMGLGIGTTSVISRAIGVGDRGRVRRLTTDSLALAVAVVSAVGGLGLVTIEPLFSAMGATPELLPLIESYMVPWYAGVGLLVIPMVGNSAIRATGDTKSPSIVMMCAGVVNIVLDPLLIFGWGPFPRLELRGAALATVVSWLVAFVAAFWMLGKRERLLDGRLPKLRDVLASWRAVLWVGVPAAATQVLAPVSAGVLTRMIAEYGPEAVAAFGVGTRVESLALIGVFALGSAVTPFVGQNFGAGDCARVREALRFALEACFIWGTGVALVLLVAARPIAALFSDHTQVVELARNYFWIIPLSYGAFGAAMNINSIYNAVNRPLHSAAIIALRLFVLAIPLAWLGSTIWQTTGVFVGVAVANAVTGVVAIVSVRRFLVRAERQLATRAAPEAVSTANPAE